ncbi:MAG TPA: hypothetical protein DC057_16275 [Spirochaetia bacterium]|nr:hypothetical protein [Spirochaetia bacterium]
MKINTKRKNDIYGLGDPYCESCGSCGESECCSSFMCLKKSVEKNKTCQYGEINLKEVRLYYNLGKKLYDLILEKGNIENVRVINKIYDELYEEIYGEKNDR